MGIIDVHPVSSKSALNQFIKFPWSIYNENSYWVPPLLMDRRKLLDKKKNPFYKHADAEFFLAKDGDKIVGRIGAIINHNHNKEHDENIGFFGFFECINDQRVADALFKRAEEYLVSKGVKGIRGPANPSVNDEYGLLIGGFDLSPMILMPYNPPYYAELIERCGYGKAKDLYCYILSQDRVYSEKLERINAALRERHSIQIRTVDMKNFSRDIEIIKEIYNAAWAKNWGAVPMTNEEIDAMAKDLKPIVVPELVLFAESHGKTIGFALSLPDINMALKHNKKGYLIPGLLRLIQYKKKIDSVRIIVLGVLEEYQKTGAAAMLFYETARRAQKLGYQYGEAGWILEDNSKMVRAAEALKGEINKRYRIYEKFF